MTIFLNMQIFALLFLFSALFCPKTLDNQNKNNNFAHCMYDVQLKKRA
jgi:hypothetical protein